MKKEKEFDWRRRRSRGEGSEAREWGCYLGRDCGALAGFRVRVRGSRSRALRRVAIENGMERAREEST